MQNKDITIFLDVDGVVNHLGTSVSKSDKSYWFTHLDEETNKRYRVMVRWPEWMPELVQYLVATYDVRWLTTWREHANVELAPLLEIPELPVITDGGARRATDWKQPVARPLAEELILQGKTVYWIEDFYRQLPFMPGVKLVDTAADGGYGKAALFGDDIAELIPMDLLLRTQRPENAPALTAGCGLCEAPVGYHESWCPGFELPF